MADERENGIETLDADECWRLLGLSRIGRLAVMDEDGKPDLFPVNYLVSDRRICFRSAPGGKLRSIGEHPDVAFEIDGQDDTHRWSVVIHGTAHAMTTAAEIEASGVSRLMSWSPTPKDHFVRVEPQTVSGRRFAKRFESEPIVPAGAAPSGSEVQDWSPHDGVLPKPWPIPHHRPEGRGA